MVLAAVLCLAGYVSARRAPGASFSRRHAMISDLGRAVCRDWHGHWVCSPRAFLFNAAVGAAGLLLLLAVVIAHRRLPKLWGAALGCLALGLLWLAVFPVDGSPVHMVGGVLALPVTSVLLMVHRCPGDHRKVPPVASWSVTVVGALSATVSPSGRVHPSHVLAAGERSAHYSIVVPDDRHRPRGGWPLIPQRVVPRRHKVSFEPRARAELGKRAGERIRVGDDADALAAARPVHLFGQRRPSYLVALDGNAANNWITSYYSPPKRSQSNRRKMWVNKPRPSSRW